MKETLSTLNRRPMTSPGVSAPLPISTSLYLERAIPPLLTTHSVCLPFRLWPSRRTPAFLPPRFANPSSSALHHRSCHPARHSCPSTHTYTSPPTAQAPREGRLARSTLARPHPSPPPTCRLQRKPSRTMHPCCPEWPRRTSALPGKSGSAQEHAKLSSAARLALSSEEGAARRARGAAFQATLRPPCPRLASSPSRCFHSRLSGYWRCQHPPPRLPTSAANTPTTQPRRAGSPACGPYAPSLRAPRRRVAAGHLHRYAPAGWGAGGRRAEARCCPPPA